MTNAVIKGSAKAQLGPNGRNELDKFIYNVYKNQKTPIKICFNLTDYTTGYPTPKHIIVESEYVMHVDKGVSDPGTSKAGKKKGTGKSIFSKLKLCSRPPKKAPAKSATPSATLVESTTTVESAPSTTSVESTPSTTTVDSAPSATTVDSAPSATTMDSAPSATTVDSAPSTTYGDSTSPDKIQLTGKPEKKKKKSKRKKKGKDADGVLKQPGQGPCKLKLLSSCCKKKEPGELQGCDDSTCKQKKGKSKKNDCCKESDCMKSKSSTVMMVLRSLNVIPNAIVPGKATK